MYLVRNIWGHGQAKRAKGTYMGSNYVLYAEKYQPPVDRIKRAEGLKTMVVTPRLWTVLAQECGCHCSPVG